MPTRLNSLKFLVKAIETVGPVKEYDVYATAYSPSSGKKVILGSSMPQVSSTYLDGSGNKVGCLSMIQSETPSFDRAAHKCDRPLLSSTRHKRSVVPSFNIVAPGLKTEFTGYGQSDAVKIGFVASRVNNISC